LLLGPYFFDAINSAHVLHTVSELGIALLLFIVGIGLNPKEVKEVGWGSAFIGVGQVLLTATATFAIAGAFGFGFVHAAYIAIAMTFSSTIVILKVLSDKEELGHLYGKIAVGFLLVQDLIATGFLIYLSSLGGEQVVWISATQSASWFIIIAAGLWFVARYVFPRISKFLAASQEYLFLFAVAWGFGVSAIVAAAGLSVEVGALMAGVTLSTQIYAQEISGRLRPLRDFFLLFFFVMLGARIDLGIFTSVLAPTIGLSLFVLVVNPLIVMGLSYTRLSIPHH
jgi:Kef-type K+ transport system membrane component KefB